MRLMTMWGERVGFEGRVPELMVAWDYYAWDNYTEGFDEDCEKARASWGDELAQWRIIEIEVSESAIIKAFDVAVVGGTPVVASQQEER
jgi:hypothetical protein